MNKKILMGTLFGLATLTVSGATFAFNWLGEGRSDVDDETRTAIHEAVSAGDYAAFQEITSELENHPAVTEEQFAEMTARAADQEVRRAEAEERRAQMDEIMADKDYEAWQEIAQDGMLEVVDTEAKFLQLVQMHEYMQAAQEIREELGLPERGQRGPGMGEKMGMNRGDGEARGQRIWFSETAE